MSEQDQIIDSAVNKTYEHGFVTDIDADTIAPGLNEDVIRLISAKKNEPEFLLKWRSKFKANSFGYYKNGKLYSKYKKIYSLTHLFLKTGKFTERQIVWFFICGELIISSLIWFV